MFAPREFAATLQSTYMVSGHKQFFHHFSQSAHSYFLDAYQLELMVGWREERQRRKESRSEKSCRTEKENFRRELKPKSRQNGERTCIADDDINTYTAYSQSNRRLFFVKLFRQSR